MFDATATAELENLRANSDRYSNGVADFAGQLAEIAVSRHGWNDTSNYESLELDLVREAAYSRRHEEPDFVLQYRTFYDTCSVSGRPRVDASRDLGHSADDIDGLPRYSKSGPYDPD